MTINDKIAKIREICCDNDNGRFASLLGLTEQYASNICKNGKNVGAKQKEHLLSVFQNINRSWLLADEGEMLKVGTTAEQGTTSSKLIPLYDVEAVAGMDLVDMTPTSRPIAMIEIGSILKDSEMAIRIYGNSMVPNYPAGCIVGVKPYRENFIVPGHAYIMETEDNRYLKRIYYNKDKSALRCVSDNTMVHNDGTMKGEYVYPDFEVPLESVRRMFSVVGVIKRDLL